MALFRLYKDRKLGQLNMVVNTDDISSAYVIPENSTSKQNAREWSLIIKMRNGETEQIGGLIQSKANGAIVEMMQAHNGKKSAEYSVESYGGQGSRDNLDMSPSAVARREKIENRRKLGLISSWAKAGGYGAPPDGWSVGDAVPAELMTENVMKAKREQEKV